MSEQWIQEIFFWLIVVLGVLAFCGLTHAVFF